MVVITPPPRAVARLQSGPGVERILIWDDRSSLIDAVVVSRFGAKG